MFSPHRSNFFDTHRPTTQPSSSVFLLHLCLAAVCPRTSGGPKNTVEEYTAIPDLPVLMTSYPGLEDGGEEEIWTQWIPSKASMSLSGSAETQQLLKVSTEVTFRKERVTYCKLKDESWPLQCHFVFSLWILLSQRGSFICRLSC